MTENDSLYQSTILIVDDMPSNLKVLSRTLEQAGYTDVVPAENAHSAMQRLQHITPNLILLDIMMPETDGFELYQMIRGHGSTAETPIIFISALSDRESIEKGFQLGAVDYITKPFHSSEVVARVTTHLRIKSYSDELSVMLARNTCLLNSAGEGIMGIDVNSHITYINPYAEQLLGYSREELGGVNVHGVIHHTHPDGTEHKAEDCPIMRVVKKGGVEYVADDVFFRKNNEQINVEYTASGLHRRFNSDECIVVFRDITDRKKVERQLKEAATVFELSTDGIVLTDRSGRITRVNPAFSDITGYGAEEVVGKNPRLLKSGHHEDAFYEEMWHEIKKSGYWEGEIWNRRKDGSIFPEWQRIRAIRDQEDEIVGYVSQFSDITRRKLTEEEIRYRGNYDALTGLVNRTLLKERVSQAIKEHSRKEQKIGLLYIDLDKFKNVNDTMGHAVGDQLLQQTALRIKDVIREFDTAARLGGDEFVVMMTDIGTQVTCERVASRLVEVLCQPFEIEGNEALIGASIGVAIYPDDGGDMETLFRNADFALYRAKDGGRNQVQFFTETMEREYVERSQLENDLRHALKRNEFTMLYQPIVDLSSGRVVGVESLLRWIHPQRGSVSPDIFIPIAEESNMIRQLGAWVFETVCHQLSEWKKRGIELYASVNVSTRQIPDGLPVDYIRDTLSAIQLPSEQLVFEITESVFVNNVTPLTDWLKSVRELGLRVYLDDFGTGYSSLSYLKQFPVDAVKVDRMFVNEITADSRDRAMVRAVLLMGEGLGLEVIAEGVESMEQYGLLQEMGCQYSQGYLFSRPVHGEMIEKSLRTIEQAISGMGNH